MIEVNEKHYRVFIQNIIGVNEKRNRGSIQSIIGVNEKHIFNTKHYRGE